MVSIGTFFLAEDLRQEGSGRYTAVGIFPGESRFSTLEDARVRDLMIYVSLQDMDVGEYKISFELDYFNGSKNLKIGSDTIRAEVVTDIAYVAQVNDVRFPGAGNYSMKCMLDDVLIAHLDFAIKIDAEDDADQS